MNILHLSTYLQGGAGRIIHELALEQKRLGNTVSLATSKTEYPGYCNYPEYLEGLTEAGIPPHLIDSFFKRDETSFQNAKSLVSELIETEAPDVIHCHASMPALAALEATKDLGRDIPIIQTMQGWGTNKTPEQSKQDIATMNQLAHVVAVSQASKSLLISLGLQAEKVSVIPNFVSPKSDANIDDADYAYLEKLSKDRKIIGCIGTLCARKNQRLLIEALSLIDESIDPLTLVLIGEGEDETKLKALAKENPSKHEILFLGYKKNADRFLALFDLFVLPSLAEGLPLAILEAFRDEILVICSDIPEHQEIVSHQNNGYLFSSDDPNSLSKIVQLALRANNSETLRITDNANCLFEKHHTLEIVGVQYLELYKNILKR